MQELPSDELVEDVEDDAPILNDDSTVERLVNENLALAHYFANKATDIDPDEAFSRAMAGLHRAAQKFDTSNGARFGTYASYWIKSSIGRVRTLMRTVKRGRGTFTFSMDAPMSDDTEDTFANTIPDDRANPLLGIDDCANHAVLMDAVAQLEDRERDIILRRFGIGCEAQTLEEIGADYKITRERIRQLEATSLEKLNRAFRQIRERKEREEIIEGAKQELQALRAKKPKRKRRVDRQRRALARGYLVQIRLREGRAVCA